MLDGVGGRDRHLERARIGVADVLAREDDHPARDEARVLAALEHPRQVEERGVRIGAARRLDPRRDQVVVLIALLVVEDGAALERVLGDRERDGPIGADGLGRELERAQRHAGVAAGARGEELERVVLHAGRVRYATLVGERPPQQLEHVRVLERVQLVYAAAGQERRVDLEERVLGRRAHEHDEPVLDGRQQRVLLRLVEAMDLVEEEDRALAARGAAVLRALEHLAHLRPPGVHRRRLLEGRARVHGQHARERRLAGPGRAVENH